MIEIFTAKSGAPSLKVDGVALHSPYDPQKEARRFVREALGDQPPSAVIVLGESLGHLARAAAEACPSAAILSARYSEEISRAAGPAAGPAWDPSHREGLEEFLRARLGELQVEGLRVIEWPPCARAFPAESRAANEAVRRVVQELNGSFVTTVAAGRLWLRNCFANFLHLDLVVDGPTQVDQGTIVIAAPGPSLEEAAGPLREARSRVSLWALPSSCAFLAAAGLEPDLVVMTDPGFYALHHLQFAPPRCPVAMPLSAASGTWGLRPRPPAILLGQPFLVEKSLLDAAGLTPRWVAPHGTVTATAIELALACTHGPVVVAGLDLGSPDLITHARPNAFDALLQLQSTRLEPHTSQWFARDAAAGAAAAPRAGGARFRTTPALRTYAGWLATGLESARGRLYRLLPSAAEIPSMLPLDGPGLGRLPGGGSAAGTRPVPRPPRSFPGPDSRRRIAQRLAAQWVSEVDAARREFSAGGADLARYPAALELAHLVSPRRLVDALRKSRLGDAAAAREAAVETLDDCRAFLGKAAEKLRG